jgi:hypothetical protein
MTKCSKKWERCRRKRWGEEGSATCGRPAVIQSKYQGALYGRRVEFNVWSVPTKVSVHVTMIYGPNCLASIDGRSGCVTTGYSIFRDLVLRISIAYAVLGYWHLRIVVQKVFVLTCGFVPWMWEGVVVWFWILVYSTQQGNIKCPLFG